MYKLQIFYRQISPTSHELEVLKLSSEELEILLESPAGFFTAFLIDPLEILIVFGIQLCLILTGNKL